jgi:hypothetical protein
MHDVLEPRRIYRRRISVDCRKRSLPPFSKFDLSEEVRVFFCPKGGTVVLCSANLRPGASECVLLEGIKTVMVEDYEKIEMAVFCLHSVDSELFKLPV